jgi:hypothetical protein
MVYGCLLTMSWRVFGLRMEETASRHTEYIENVKYAVANI